MVSVPQPRSYPLVGNAPSIDIETPIQSMMQLAQELGPVYRLQFPSQTILVVGEHTLVDEVCDEARFEKIVHAPLRELRDLGGDALFTADNDAPAWAIAHRVLMPAFSPLAMRRYWTDMVDIADQLVTKWERLGPHTDHDVADSMTRLTLDTIALTGFGYRFNSYYQREMHPFVDSMVRALGEAGARTRRLPLQSKLMVRARRQYDRDLELMYDVVDTVIRERRAAPPRAEGTPKDLLDLLLDADELTDVQLRFQMMTFLIAGHETTSGLLSFAIHMLLENPHTMERAIEEVDRVLGSDHAQPIKFEHLAQLGYLEQVLKETLRLWPTAPAFGRTPKEDTVLSNGIPVHKGDVLLVLTPTLHRDPAIWTDPEAFEPERFAGGHEYPPHAWKPFGTGQRACIGRAFAMQEAMLVLASLLWKFELTGPEGYELRVKESLTLKPDGLTLRAKRRPSVANTNVAPVVAAKPEQVTRAQHGTPLLVLYGSNSGSAKDFGERVARDATARGYAAKVATLDEHVNDLPRDRAVVIVTGSYNGQPPDNARAFVQWADGLETGALTGVRYTVLGLGHRDWATTYQAVPRRIDAALARAGATAIHERGEADAGGDFFGAFETWSEAALADVDKAFEIESVPVADLARYEIEHVGEPAETIAAAYGAVTMQIVENRELVHGDPMRSKRHIEIAMPPGVTYQSGDYLAVLPHNDDALVLRAAQRLGIEPDDTIILRAAGSSLLPTNIPITIGQLLGRYVELSAAATRSDIKTLVAHTPCPPEARELAALPYETEILAKRTSILDLLERFASTTVPLAKLLEMLPPLKPRRYSISSSPLAKPDRCTLTVAVLDAPAWSGQGRYRGACSNYLANLAPGAQVYAAVVKPNTPFRLPTDPQVPVIMIGAGTGIAPFRGFVEERAALSQPLGPAHLYFGCDHPDVDFLYREELAAWQDSAHVEVHPAFFKQPDGDVIFVQHRLWQDIDRVAELLEAGAHIYVCGDGKRMAPAVRETLAKIADVDHLEATGRYVADVFSG
jgi:cytochrome P450/NADPH-cytochrome P450 reductase